MTAPTARSSLTLLLVTRAKLARADIRPGSPVAFATALRSDDGGIADAVRDAMNLAGRPVGPVWILADDVSAQSAGLPASAVRGVGEEELRQAIAYEAQMVSGLEPMSTLTEWCVVPAGVGARQLQYKVVQLPAHDRDAADDAVRACGGRLAGIVHPAGLPRRLSAPSVAGAGWARTEVWPGSSVTVTAVEHEGSDRESRGAAIDAEYLIGVDVTGTPAVLAEAPSNAALFRLDADDELASWLSVWADVLATLPLSVPRILPMSRPMTRAARFALTAALAAAMLVTCAAHFTWSRSLAASLRSDAATVRAPSEELARIDERIRSVDAAVRAARAVALADDAEVDGARRARDLPARCLTSVAVRAPEGLRVTALEIAPDRSVIHGECERPELADELARGLSLDFAGTGFVVESPLRHTNASGGGAAVEVSAAPRVGGAAFRFDLEILGPPNGGPAPQEERP